MCRDDVKNVASGAQGQVGATYALIVSNGGTGPTSGLVTVSDTLPAGLTATAASGTGWSCSIGATVSCTRSDALAASASYPVIKLTVDVAANAAARIHEHRDRGRIGRHEPSERFVERHGDSDGDAAAGARPRDREDARRIVRSWPRRQHVRDRRVEQRDRADIGRRHGDGRVAGRPDRNVDQRCRLELLACSADLHACRRACRRHELPADRDRRRRRGGRTIVDHQCRERGRRGRHERGEQCERGRRHRG